MIYSQAYKPTAGIANGNNGIVLVGEYQLFNQRSGDLGGIAVDPSGSLYVADPIYNVILKILMDGTVIIWAGKTGVAGNNGNNRVKGRDARFNGVSGLSCDRNGNLYASDRLNNQIRKITPDQYVSLVAGDINGKTGFRSGMGSSALFNSPNDISVDKTGNIYVADTNNHAIRLIQSGTSVVSTIAGNGVQGDSYGVGIQSRLRYPYSVAAKPNGDVLICDSGNFKVKLLNKSFYVLKFSGSGVEGSYLGDLRNEALTCQYNNMRYSDVDPSGNLYVIDFRSNLDSRLLRINNNGIPGVVRDFTASTDNNYVAGVGVNNTGVLFVTESEYGGE
jgi:hypothetical protein